MGERKSYDIGKRGKKKRRREKREREKGRERGVHKCVR